MGLDLKDSISSIVALKSIVDQLASNVNLS